MTKSKGSAIEIVVFGVVQGVGFRPFIYRLAHELEYKGWVKNIGFGVEIHLEEEKSTDFKDFLHAFQENLPPLAQIEKMNVKPASFQGLEHFEIKKTKQEESFVFISPDIAVCENCHTEMMMPSDRRFHYPFINCTDCGPRYTIVRSLPYDRKKTTMKSFLMCPSCRREYTNPLDRRNHAQPIACPTCGPQVKLLNSKTGKDIKGGIKKAAFLLREGKILSVKGLGGFHLVCDALNAEAVQRLRKIKERKTKPLALMAKNLEIIGRFAHTSSEERAELLSPRRPIVLLKKKKDIQGIAPHLDEMGFMLPYTPLHYLLLEDFDLIVATSSNKKDAPIMKDEEEGIDELCDYILTHDRPIHMRADDSVMKVVNGQPLFVRRARGYVPYPQPVPEELKSPHHVLALGGELKDTISLYKNGYVITSQFLGDLDEYQNFQYFEETIRHLTKLFEIKPKVVVSDLHPDFHTTRHAQKLNIPHLKVQHHYAHVLAPLLEHKYPTEKKVLGVAFDGYGFGEDGTAWGGEFLLADYTGYERFARFTQVPLPGGDLAAKQPWRMALSFLVNAYEENIPALKVFKKVSPRMIDGVREMIKQNIQVLPTSSCGRLFDAVSFLLGLSPVEMEFEAEAPMRLEAAAAEGVKGKYRFDILEDRISFKKTIQSIVEDLERGVPVSHISAKFHNTLASVISRVAQRARKIHGIDTVVLVGGVFLNRKLTQAANIVLKREGFSVLRPIRYSPNDESISVGQIAYALMSLRNAGFNP
ncbi:MAG: carbamoyltransferase HypF [Candidatus Aminicenantes bacterium]|nr:carbamoyltransferase HypF [Candidatus Aminicenantes bacterium]MDH5384283.1 carbamoyltransferase HypF [Candidatus Aminicenantes bacterium]